MDTNRFITREIRKSTALSKDKLFEQYCGEAVMDLINREVVQDPSWYEGDHIGKKGKDSGVDYVILCHDVSSPTYGIILVQAKWLEHPNESASSNFESSGLINLVDFANICYSGDYDQTVVTNQKLQSSIGKYRKMLEEFRTEAAEYLEDDTNIRKEPRVPRIYLVTCASRFAQSFEARAKEYSAMALDFPLLEYLTNSAEDSIAIPAPPEKFLRMSAHLVEVDDGDKTWGYDAYVGYANATQLTHGLYQVEGAGTGREPGLLYTTYVRDSLTILVRRIFERTCTRQYNRSDTLLHITTAYISLQTTDIQSWRKFVTLEQPQLVNGGQTINALWDMNFGRTTGEVRAAPEALVDVKVPIKIITCENQDSLNKLRAQIAKASNDQNPTEQRDLISNMPSIVARKRQFRKFKIYYETKRGVIT